MRKILLTSVFVFLLSAFIFAQITPVNRPAPSATPVPFKDATRGADISNRSNDLRMLEKFPVKTDHDRKVLNDKVKPLYRSSTKKELATIAPTTGVAGQYTAFLKGKNTGINRLAADIGCFTVDDVVSAKPECRKHTMPGAGSAYSFRVEDYRIKRLADLNFRKGRLEALGMLSHGVMVYLGDVPIENVSLNSGGIAHLRKIKPAKNFGEAGAFADKLIKGYKKDDFIYASVMKAIPGRTYVLRSIAYRGTAEKSVRGFVYNELDFDKRRDVIIAFRVAAMNPGRDITLVWKELKDSKAPKLKASK